MDTMLPVLDGIAKEQAACHYAGQYASAYGNSSLTLATAPGRPGLLVKQWISDGVDFTALLATLQPDLIYRIVPNQLFGGRQSWFHKLL